MSVRRHLEGEGEVLTKETIFWSVVHSQPARFHRTRVGAEASLAGVWIVQLHRIMRMDPSSREALVSLKAALPASVTDLQDAGLAMRVNQMTLHELRTVRVWKAQEGLQHCFDVQLMSQIPASLHVSVSELLRAMIQQPEGLVVTADMSRDMLEALDTLAAERVVEGPPWQLTEVAKERVEQCVLLRNEESLLQRCAGELSEASTYQLILEMDAQGWVHEIVSVREYRDMKRAQAAYRHGELKVWRTCEVHSSVSRYYLLALLLKGPEMPVPHVAKQETYMKMLGISLEDSGQLNRGRKRNNSSTQTKPTVQFQLLMCQRIVLPARVGLSLSHTGLLFLRKPRLLKLQSR